MSAAADAATDGGATTVRALGVVRVAYRACFWLGFGFVYPLAQLARLAPKSGPAADGLRDGARAASESVARLRSLGPGALPATAA